MLIDDEVVMLLSVLLVEDEHVRNYGIVPAVIPRLHCHLELRVVVLRSAWSCLGLCPLVHCHLCHSMSGVFTTILIEVVCTVRMNDAPRHFAVLGRRPACAGMLHLASPLGDQARHLVPFFHLLCVKERIITLVRD